DVLRSRCFRAGKRSRRTQLECQPDWQRCGQQFAEHHPAPECADADRRECGQQSGSDGDELANRTSGEDGVRSDGGEQQHYVAQQLSEPAIQTRR
ncbi:hypothetical protein AZ019_000991, partial [Klebsiella pneumoniae]